MKLRDGEYDHTEDFSEGADVYLDVDREGSVPGLKALSFEDLTPTIGARGGKLDVTERLIFGDRSQAPELETINFVCWVGRCPPFTDLVRGLPSRG